MIMLPLQQGRRAVGSYGRPERGIMLLIVCLFLAVSYLPQGQQLRSLHCILSAPFQQDGAASIQFLAECVLMQYKCPWNILESQVSKEMSLGIRVSDREGSFLNLELHLWGSRSSLTLSYSYSTRRGLSGVFLCHFHSCVNTQAMVVGPVAPKKYTYSSHSLWADITRACWVTDRCWVLPFPD